ncbi:hypothetical protein DDB_G0276641 [Dictyostelium discoideum AX4]|uniref:Uncharacterized protein n=1 Tax=Dictyostelium discoideum TaxID=44689 RepID=Q551E4_DICDI|nr:hypothetical protein DDB_G0276641 [Dictyostelium discoideum AX4]EAL69133.1 hypothetical protein DDB_G0276641 [Dictyostelium discoideum AX4]|eukprot:XP_643049.1 hypothetical protein DDB_G0276641 [Dictyostelium discoideum AX4]
MLLKSLILLSKTNESKNTSRDFMENSIFDSNYSTNVECALKRTAFFTRPNFINY